jgi:hypothetical protein
MQGYGKHLTEVDARQQKERENSALMMREQAIARYRSERNMAEATHAGEVQAGLDTVRTRNEITKTNETLPVRTQAEIQVANAREAAGFQTWLKKQPIEMQRDMTLEQLKQQHRLEVEGVQQAGQDRRTQMQETAAERRLRLGKELEGGEVGHVDVSTDGRKVFYDKKGNRISKTHAGAFNPSRAPNEDAGGSEFEKELQAMRNRTAPAGTIRTLSPDGGAGHQKITPGEYQSALRAALADPDNRGKSQAEVKQMVDDMLKSAGYGRAPEPKAEMQRELTRLATLYSRATPETHPGLFRNGQKIPLEEVRQQIIASFGNK